MPLTFFVLAGFTPRANDDERVFKREPGAGRIAMQRSGVDRVRGFTVRGENGKLSRFQSIECSEMSHHIALRFLHCVSVMAASAAHWASVIQTATASSPRA